MSEILVNTIKKADGTGSITVPAETGTVLTSASDIQSQALSDLPLCDAYINSSTFNVSNGVMTKIAFDQARSNSDASMLDGTNYRITVPVSGYYNTQVILLADDVGSTLERVTTRIYKNGASLGSISDVHMVSGTGKNATISASLLLPLNANDYLEIYASLSNDGTTQLRFYGEANGISAFQVTFVRPL